MAVLDDQESAPTCESVRGIADQVTIYPNGGYGMILFSPTLILDPPIGKVVFELLVKAFGKIINLIRV